MSFSNMALFIFIINLVSVSSLGTRLFFSSQLCFSSEHLSSALPLGLINSLTYFSSYRLFLIICSKLSFKRLPLFFFVVVITDSFFNFLKFILRETECKQGRGRERRRQRIPSRLRAVSVEPDQGLGPRNCEIMTRAEIKSQTFNQLSHPGTPSLCVL